MRYDLMPVEDSSEVSCGTSYSFTPEFGGWVSVQAQFYPAPTTHGLDVFGSVLAVKWDDPNGNWVADGNGASGIEVIQNECYRSIGVISYGMPDVPAHISFAVYLFVEGLPTLYWYFSHPELNNGL